MTRPPRLPSFDQLEPEPKPPAADDSAFDVEPAAQARREPELSIRRKTVRRLDPESAPERLLPSEDEQAVPKADGTREAAQPSEASASVSARPAPEQPSSPAPRPEPSRRPSAATEKTAPGTPAEQRPQADILDFRPRRRNGWGRRLLLSAIAAAVLSAIVVVLASVTPWMTVQTVTVEGNKFVKREAVEKIASKAKGQAIPRVDVRRLAQQIEEIPGVAQARIAASPPHGIRVIVVERPPVAQVRRTKGIDLVDGSGKTITTVKDSSAYKLPVISEATAGQPEVFSALTQALSNVPESILSDMQEARAKTPDSIELLLNSGVVVVWGNQEKAVQKAATLQAFLKAMAKQKPDPKTGALPPSVQTIDVSVPENPVTR